MTGDPLPEPAVVSAAGPQVRFPEVISHRNDGPSWDDVILRSSQGSQWLWQRVVESIGGSTA